MIAGFTTEPLRVWGLLLAMFQLNELSLRNFKCHRKLDIQFKPGVNAITGTNGIGKSCIVKAIQFVNTGEVNTAKSNLTKDDLITRGEATGYVWESFTLMGKPGTIERHLDVSKTVLEYDGQKYLKSGQVNELWATLLQIDPNIFSNVIIAHQNQIPILFTGSATDREKIFQKIFMVPPTEKIRRVVWDKYITKCPPPLPEESVNELKVTLQELSGRINPLRVEHDMVLSTILTEQQVMSVLGEVNRLNACIADEKKRPLLLTRKEQLTKEQGELSSKIAELAEMLTHMDEKYFQNRFNELLTNRGKLEAKYSSEAKLAQLKAGAFNPDPAVLTKLEQEAAEARELNTSMFHKHESVAKEVQALVSSIEDFTSIKGKETCPKCKQKLVDIQQFIKDTEAQIAALDAQRQEAAKDHNVAYNEMVAIEGMLKQARSRVQAIQTLETQIAEMGTIDFNQEEFDLMTQVIKKVKEDQAQLRTLRTKLSTVENDITLTDMGLSQLQEYKGANNAAYDLAFFQSTLETNRRQQSERSRLELEISKVEIEIKMSEERIQRSLQNQTKNRKRDSYLGLLQRIYEVLHTSKFPRELIQSYSSLVEEELGIQLSKFSIPYRARIVEGFKLEIINKDGYVLPEVSGGQENIIGLCLRLALHSLFSQSFPLLIVDEGTTNLHAENVKLYFDLIKSLKEENVIKQLILIDHHESLQSVVDHTIELK